MIKKDYLDEKEATFYMSQLLSAINYCHQNKIVHLDLKVIIVLTRHMTCM